MHFFSTLFLSLLLVITPKSAEMLEEKKEYLEAAKQWQELIASDPENPFYYYKLGKNFYALHEYDRAEESLNHALSMDPKNPDFLVLLAYINLRQKKLKESAALFEKALKKSPHYQDARLGLEQAKKELALQQNSVDDEDEIFNYLIQLEAEERYDEILRIWQELCAKEPNNYSYLFELGRAYAQLERYDEAIESYQKSLALDPGNSDVLASMGYAALYKNEYELAEQAFNKALAVAPQNTDAKEGIRRLRILQEGGSTRQLADQANRLEEEGKSEQAIALWEELVQSQPDHAYYLYRLGRLLQRSGHTERATQYLEHALALSPADVDIQVSLGYLYLQRGSYAQAEELFAQVLQKKPNYLDAEKGLELAQKGREEPAPKIAVETPKEEIALVESLPQEKNEEEVVLSELLVQEEDLASPSSPDPFEHALELEKNGHFEEALVIWEALAEEDPKNAYYPYKIGRLYMQMGRDILAQRALIRAHMLDPTNSDVAVSLAYVYLHQGKEKRASQLFAEVLEQSPDYEDAKKGLALIERHKADRADPKKVELRQLYEKAMRYENEGKTAQAAEVWLKLVAVDPENSFALYRLGRFYAGSGRTEEAEVYYRRSLKHSPDHADTKVVLGYLLVAKGEFEEARQLFLEVLKAVPTYQDAEKGLLRIDELIAAAEEKKEREEKLEITRIAVGYEEKLDFDNAAAKWEELYCQHPDDPFFIYHLGRIYSQQRKYRKALPYLEEALCNDAQSEAAKYRLALNYQALGCRGEALQLFSELQEEFPQKTAYIEGLANSHRALNSFSNAVDAYTQRFTLGEPHYGLFRQRHSTGKWTDPSASGNMLYAQERETDIVTRVLSAQRNTTIGGGKYLLPICDRFRLAASIQSGVIREMNLVAGLNNLFMKQQDYSLGAVWLIHPEFSIAANFDYQVGRDIGVPIFPIGHRYRILPSLFFNYDTPTHVAQLRMEYDTLLIKEFTAVPSKGNLLKRLTLLIQDEQLWFYRSVKVGGEAFYRYYEGSPFNRQWQGALYGQVGFPKYRPCFSIRYWGQVGGFLTNLTDYYSYKRQWQHTAFVYFSKQAPLNMQIDVAFEQAWQWNRALNQPVNTLVFVERLFRSYERIYFEVSHVYRPNTEFHLRTTSYWDSTKYTAWDVKGSLTHIF